MKRLGKKKKRDRGKDEKTLAAEFDFVCKMLKASGRDLSKIKIVPKYADK